jgi:undecaprenyl-diphosphatase
MIVSRGARLFQWVDAYEQRLCRSLNRGLRRPALRDLFVIVSRLGDGLVWYVLVLLIPVRYGEAGLKPGFVMAATGIVGVAL